MPKTQFFTRKSDNLENYKNNFKKALTRIKTVKLFSDEVINFLQNWIDSQTSYIPRSDVENLGKHIELVYKDKEYKKKKEFEKNLEKEKLKDEQEKNLKTKKILEKLEKM